MKAVKVNKKLNIHWGENNIDPLPMYYRAMLRQVILAGLKICNKSSCEISISFVLPSEIKKINNEYRNKNTPTDVLSFESGIIDKNDKNGKISGEIIICPQIAQNQAEEYCHSIDREMAFLTAHGFLHLNGYDHIEKEDEAVMINLQNAILEEVGILR